METSRDPTPHEVRSRALLWVSIAYLAAALLALLVGIAVHTQPPLVVAAGADLAATLVVFAFSLAFRNSSFYDPYWSVVPPLLGLYFVFAGSGDAPLARQLLVLALVTLWAVRLTLNWARGWGGLDHQDWRYVDIQQRTGRLYWPVSLLGIHLGPTVIVFLGCLPLWPALATGEQPLRWLDGLAGLVCLAGIALEHFADEALRRFRRSGSPTEAVLETGLWAWSRHPNYLGEMLFWWGLAFFGWAAAGFVWWAWLGALTVTALFRFASLPMMERHLLERRPAYAQVQQRVPLVLPRPPRSG